SVERGAWPSGSSEQLPHLPADALEGRGSGSFGFSAGAGRGPRALPLSAARARANSRLLRLLGRAACRGSLYWLLLLGLRRQPSADGWSGGHRARFRPPRAPPGHAVASDSHDVRLDLRHRLRLPDTARLADRARWDNGAAPSLERRL